MLSWLFLIDRYIIVMGQLHMLMLREIDNWQKYQFTTHHSVQ